MPDSFMVSGVFGMFFIHKKGLPHFILVRQPLFMPVFTEIRMTISASMPTATAPF